MEIFVYFSTFSIFISIILGREFLQFSNQQINATSGTYYGSSTSIYYPFAVVGCQYCGNIRQGSIVIWQHDGISWSEKQELFASNPLSYSQFGMFYFSKVLF